MERRRLSLKIACMTIVIVVCVAAGALFMPHKFIKSDAEIKWLRVSYNKDEISLSDEQADMLGRELRGLTVRRVEGSEGMSYDDVTYEIDLIADGEICHIVLGKWNYCYHSAGAFRYFKIVSDVDELNEMLDNMLDNILNENAGA
ncbi:MAG: hypothetical protein SPJ45_09940 [Anaerovoracaceae bacterium]|nr:hypothetical protein [Bacillota bacterium]MDY5907171.1 hypothetical protein [Anaerovoracaceae bacterium]